MFRIYLSTSRSALRRSSIPPLSSTRTFHSGLVNYGRKKATPDTAGDIVSATAKEDVSADESKVVKKPRGRPRKKLDGSEPLSRARKTLTEVEEAAKQLSQHLSGESLGSAPKPRRKKQAEAAEADGLEGNVSKKSMKATSTHRRKSKASGEAVDNASVRSFDDYTMQEYLTVAKIRSLGERAKKPGGAPAAKDKTRIDIVSEELCDRVIERLKPSLQRHIGCDIVEMNPGAGVFSSKLHNILQPRNHILLEPDPDLYLPFLQPLLTTEGSTYKLLTKSGMFWENLDEAFSKTYLPEQELLEKGDPRLEKANNTLLFVANVGHFPTKQFGNARNFSKLFLYQMLEAIRTHTTFQGYGLVRVLLWVPDGEKHNILPRTIQDRRAICIDADLSCEGLYEIAGGDGTTSMRAREASLNTEVSARIIQRMNQAGFQTPEHRKTRLEIEGLNYLAGEAEDNIGKMIIRKYHNELDELEGDFASGKLLKYTDDAKARALDPSVELVPDEERPIGTRSPKYFTPGYLRLRHLRQRFTMNVKQDNFLSHLVEEYEAITEERERLLALGEEAKGDEQLALDDRIRDWEIDYERRNGIQQALVWILVDNRRAWRVDPPLLMWDRRYAEPIKVMEEDFVPAHNMCLLDIQPKSIWPALRQNRAQDWENFDYIVSQLFMFPTQSVKKWLESLAHGAYDWIVPECPSLTDPKKGGSRSLDDLRVRCVTMEMLEEILKSWMKWPFKPNRYQLMVKTGRVVRDDEGSLEIDDYLEDHSGLS